MERLTIIIPFLNEGTEVANTLSSFCQYATSPIDIILINDASDDLFDYKKVASDFNAVYIEHQIRKGVAVSREEGIVKCKTNYFLLLDAHMRAYQKGWDRHIIDLLDSEDKQSVYCCRTRRIISDYSVIQESYTGCGCMLNILDLSYKWLNFTDSESELIDIPCVMGASYVCNKEYWNYLRGLEGLCSYGLDEQFLSMKAYLSGGGCKLINKIIFGHLFRDLSEVPYRINNLDYIYNMLYIAEFLYSFDAKMDFFKQLRERVNDNELYTSAVRKLAKVDIEEHKKYYSGIFVKTIAEFDVYNYSFIDFLVKEDMRRTEIKLPLPI